MSKNKYCIRKTQDPTAPYAQTPGEQMIGGVILMLDGLVRVASLGRLAAPWSMSWAIRCAKRKY